MQDCAQAVANLVPYTGIAQIVALDIYDTIDALIGNAWRLAAGTLVPADRRGREVFIRNQ